MIIGGIVLQFIVAIIVLKTQAGSSVLQAIATGFVAFVQYGQEGSRFLFGSLLDTDAHGFILALQVLPPLIFLSAATTALYHIGLLPKIVGWIGRGLSKIMPVSGAESLSVAANIFVGQTEAPLVVKPYIRSMTESELFLMMVGGMASVAGNMLAAYIGVLAANDPAQQVFFARHLLAASFMSAPAAIVIAKIMAPEMHHPVTMGRYIPHTPNDSSNIIEALAVGASEGLKLALNVGAMLIAFIAVVAVLNAPLAQIGEWLMIDQRIGRPLDLSIVLGLVFVPLAWLCGVASTDVLSVGALLGEKVIFNEFVAYYSLAKIQETMQPASVLFVTYALCGFANIGSVAVQVGGIGALAPERRPDLARLGLRSIVGGTLATMMTGTIVILLV